MLPATLIILAGRTLNDAGELVILTTDMSAPVVNGIQSAAGGDRIILPCAVSLNEMSETIKLLGNHIVPLNAQGVEVVEIRDDILSGKVIVSVIDLDEEKEEIIRTVVDCDYLKFQNADNGCRPFDNIEAGAEITNMGTGSSATMGFAALRNGSLGFVTAGHFGHAVLDGIYYEDKLIGRVEKVSYHDGMTADASFIGIVRSRVTPVAEVVNGYRIASARTTELPANSTVSMYGMMSGLETGKIVSYNVEKKYEDGYTFKNFASTTCSGQPGDSGGPVLVYNGGYNYSLIGIISGGNSTYSYFTPYKNIVEELGITCITYYT